MEIWRSSKKVENVILLQFNEKNGSINSYYYVLKRTLLRRIVGNDVLLNIVNVGALSRTENGFKQNEVYSNFNKTLNIGKLGSIVCVTY